MQIALRKFSLNTVNGVGATDYAHVANSSGVVGYATIGIIVPVQDGLILREQFPTHNVFILSVSVGSGQAFRGCALIWRRTVTAAPASATFNDVPVGNPFHRFVEALVSSGITGGCGGGNYCPDAPITRGQMAVFLAAALGLHWPN